MQGNLFRRQYCHFCHLLVHVPFISIVIGYLIVCTAAYSHMYVAYYLETFASGCCFAAHTVPKSVVTARFISGKLLDNQKTSDFSDEFQQVK